MSNHHFDFGNNSIRNLVDDFGRHRLTDLKEVLEDDFWSRSYEYFKRRIGSMDTIWETHPHRLNEAGLVRHSDNSVLTEDTDSFIIGDKIWVGGTKPGQIAYIGETQFAPGEWAGIVLDHAIGKNDGSVGGVRYFQCEPKRGVFSRLTRLTRLPLPETEESSYITTPAHVNNGVKHRGGSPLSPTGSVRSLRKSPSLSASNTSLSSTATPQVIDFKIGDRVIIKSSQGSKVGTLRFMGTTNFASGEWCGVELDDPRGKNDGSVEGVRYFECRPQFGLFAPIAKVSKSPLKYKPGNCVIHSGAGLPPSGMKRAGSKESMTSSIASTASNARRDVLREKQQHIEQLLKERDLENAEFTRAANHAENVERQLAILKNEYEYYRSECEAKLNEFTNSLTQLNIDRDNLLSQLDDEKRRNEDLQFRFEEAAITKGDIEVINQTNIHRIQDLERNLQLERQKLEQFELESGKLFEAEEALVKSHEENDTLKSELQHLRKKREILEQEYKASTESTTILKQQLETTKTHYENYQIQTSKKIDELKVDMAASQSKKMEMEKASDEYKEKLTQQSSACEVYQQEIHTLKEELSQVRIELKEKSFALTEQIKTDSAHESNFKVEIERLKAELANKNKELVVKDEAISLKVDEIRSLKALLETTQIDLNAKSVDIERYQRSKQDAEIVFNKEIDYLKKTLKEKITERENIEKTYSIQLSQTQTQLEESTKTISRHVEEINRLQVELNESKIQLERNSVDVHERHTRQIAIKESELLALASELQSKKEELTKCTIVSTKLEDDICVKNGIIDKLRLELESLKKKSELDQTAATDYTGRISTLQLTIGDLQRKLASIEEVAAELREQKHRLENELQRVITSTGDYSEELQKLNNLILEKEQSIINIRNEFTQKLQISQSVEQQLQLQLQKVNEDSERAVINLEEKLKTTIQSEQMLREQCNNANGEAIKIREQLMLKVNQLQSVLEEKEFALKVATNDNAENKRYLSEQLERTTGELQKTIDSCQRRINEITAENMNCQNVLTQRAQELIESEAKLKHFITQSQINETEIRRMCEEEVKKIQFDLGEKSAQVNQFQTELDLLKRDCQNRNVNIEEKDQKISHLSVQLANSFKLIDQLQNEKDALQLSEVEANKKWSIQNQQCTDLVNQVAILSGKAELADKLAQEYEMQKTVHQQLLNQLKVTEEQKQELIGRLESEVHKNGDAEKCVYMLELVKNLQASASDSYTKKITELQEIIETTRLNLKHSEDQVDSQKEEILRLQNEMLKAQQQCEGYRPQSDNIRDMHGYIPNRVPYPLQNPAFLQVQLMSIKNSYSSLMQKFVESQKLNFFLINKLQNAVANGDQNNVYAMLRDLHHFKLDMHALRNNIEQDKFKFQKIISYALLSLHRKQVELNVQNHYIKQLQSNYNSLPTQCKLLHYNNNQNMNAELPNETQIELEKAIDLIKVKDEQIQNLKTHLINMQDNCKARLGSSSSNSDNNAWKQFTTPNCSPKIIVKKVPAFQYLLPQSCKQSFPQYLTDQISHLQNCSATQTVIQKVPIYLPRIVVKEVPRYVNENFKCPTPQIIYQKVPVPLPSRGIVKLVPSGQTVADQQQIEQNLRLQIQDLLRNCRQMSLDSNLQSPIEQNVVGPQSGVLQPLTGQNECEALRNQVHSLTIQLNNYRQQYLISNMQLTNALGKLSTSNNVDVTVLERQQNEINALKLQLINLKAQCSASNLPFLNQDYSKPTHHQSLIQRLLLENEQLRQQCQVPGNDQVNILQNQIRNLESAFKACRESADFNKQPIIGPTKPDMELNNVSPQTGKDIEIDLLKKQIHNLRVQLNYMMLNPVNGYTPTTSGAPNAPALSLAQQTEINELKVTIQNLLIRLDEVQKTAPRVVIQKVPVPQMVNSGPGSGTNILITQLQNLRVQYDIARNYIRDLLANKCLPGHTTSEFVPNRTPELNLNMEAEIMFLRNQVQNLLIRINSANLIDVNKGGNNNYSPTFVPVNNTGILLRDIEIDTLRGQINNLLLQLETSRFCVSEKVPSPAPSSPSTPDHYEITALKNKVQHLTIQLNKAHLDIQHNFAKNCPASKIIPQPVPIVTVVPADINKINELKQQIQNILMQSTGISNYPTVSAGGRLVFSTAMIKQENVVNLLHLQLKNLLIQYSTLQQNCIQQQRQPLGYTPTSQTQPPQVITKFVTIPVLTSPNINQVPKCSLPSHPTQPQIITKTVPTPVTLPPRVIIKQTPIYIRQPCQVFNSKPLLNVPDQPQLPLFKPQSPNGFAQTTLPQTSCPKTSVQYIPIVQRRPPQIITKNVPILIPQAPRVITKTVPKFITQPCFNDNASAIPTSEALIKPAPYVLPQSESPRIITKYIPQPCPEAKIRHIFVSKPVPPQVITKTVPVPISQPPRIITQEVPKYITQPCPGPQVKYIPVPQPLQQPQIITKTIPVPVPQPARIITKEIPRYISQPCDNRSQQPYIITKRVPVLIPQPSQIISQEVPRYITQPCPKASVKYIPVTQCAPPQIVTKTVTVPVFQPPRIVVPEKPKYIAQPCPRPEVKYIPLTQPPPQIIRIPVPVYQAPKIITKDVFRYVPQPCNISPTGSQPTRVITKTVPVSVPQSPQIVTKEIPRYIYKPCPNSNIKPIFVPQPSPPQIITKNVPVYIPQRPRIITQEIPRYIEKPCPKVDVQFVPIPQPPPPPQIITRIVPLPVPQPPRIITQEVPRYITRQCLTSNDSQASLGQAQVITKTVPVPVFQPPRIITQEVPRYINQPCPKVDVQYIPVPQPPPPPQIITKTVPVSIPQAPRIITQEVPRFINQPCPKQNVEYIPIPQPPSPPRIITKTVPVPVFQKSLPPKIITKTITVPVAQPPPPPKIITKTIPVLVPQPARTITQEVPRYITQECPKQEVKYISQPPKIITKTVTIPVPQPPPPPKIITKSVPIPIPQPPPPPKIITKMVPVFIAQPAPPPKIITKTVPIPILPPPRIIRQEVPRYITQPCGNANIKHVPVYIPRFITKFVPTPSYSVPEKPSSTIVNEGPASQQPQIAQLYPMSQYIDKPPKIITKNVPVPVPQPPKIITKEVPVYIPQPCPKQEIKYIPVPSPPTVTNSVPVSVPEQPRIVIKEVPRYISQPCVGSLPGSTEGAQGVRVVIKKVLVSRPPKVIIKKEPFFDRELCSLLPVPKIIIKEVPIPSQQNCSVPKYVIQQVPFIQPPKVIIKTVVSPPEEIIQRVLIPVPSGSSCPPPQIITKRIPIIKTVVQEVPVSQPPRIIIKTVQVPQLPQVILKKVMVPIKNNIECPPPRVIVEKIRVPEPPRIIIKQIPIVSPSRIIVQEKQQACPPHSGGHIKIVPVPQPPKTIIKEVYVPTNQNQQCNLPQIIFRDVPQPPKIVIQNVPVILPPKVIIKKVPVGNGINCRVPQQIVKTIPIIQPPRTVIKEVPIPQPPQIVVKEVPNVQPIVHIKYVPVPINNGIACPPPKVIIQKVAVPQPPRTIVTQVLVPQQPRIIEKQVFVPRPPQVIITEVPRIVSIGSAIVKANNEDLKVRIYNLENRLNLCLINFNAQVSQISNSDFTKGLSLECVPQCASRLQRQNRIIQKLKYGIKYLCLGRKNNNYQGPVSPSLKLPLPMMHLIKSAPQSSLSSIQQPQSTGLHSIIVKALHEAFSFSQKALTKCMNAVLLLQLENISKPADGSPWGGRQQLLDEKQRAELQIEFLNSIIVDMQQKNEEQRARIHLLESGYSAAAVNELNLFEQPSKTRPPRVYCDICEIFDDHETEDCPIQSAGSDLVPFNQRRKRAVVPADRPYCEICEIFGHCTEDCKEEDQTF